MRYILELEIFSWADGRQGNVRVKRATTKL